MVQSAMLRLLNHFPDRSMSPVLRDAYNQRTQDDYEWIRDFIILHYKASTRNDSPFWRDCTAMDIPDSLKTKIDIFRANGLVATQTDDLFRETSWVQVLLGQGIIPERPNPSTAMIDEQSLLSFMGDIKSIHANALGMMQEHSAFVARHCRQRGAA
jgi:tryptophan halogenase